MCSSLIRHVDPWQDAARGARYKAELAAVRLPRLCALVKLVEPLQVAISFAYVATHRGAVQVELSVGGRIELDCQRCLEPLTVELAVHNKIWIVRDDAAARAIESSAEAIVSAPGEHLELAALVEDEALLGMPFSPCHPIAQCGIDRQGHGQSEGQAGSTTVYVAEAGAEQDNDLGQNPGADMGAGLGKAVGRGAPAEFNVREEPVSKEVWARSDNELTGVEARQNPFAVLASLREGHSGGDGNGDGGGIKD